MVIVGIAHVFMFEPASPAVGLLDHLPGWECVYADTYAVVHRKQTP